MLRYLKVNIKQYLNLDSATVLNFSTIRHIPRELSRFVLILLRNMEELSQI